LEASTSLVGLAVDVDVDGDDVGDDTGLGEEETEERWDTQGREGGRAGHFIFIPLLLLLVLSCEDVSFLIRSRFSNDLTYELEALITSLIDSNERRNAPTYPQEGHSLTHRCFPSIKLSTSIPTGWATCLFLVLLTRVVTVVTLLSLRFHFALCLSLLAAYLLRRPSQLIQHQARQNMCLAYSVATVTILAAALFSISRCSAWTR
jgi:hypothetical protein